MTSMMRKAADNNLREHYRKVRKVLILMLALNWAVALAKIIYGLISRSSSMTADGFHSLADGMSNIVGLIGITFAAQPKDHDHPYGHKKYETLFSLGIGAMLAFVCVNLFKEGIKRFYHPVVPQVDVGSFLVMVVTTGVNIAVMLYEYKKGKQLHSDILVSDSLHTRADIFTSFSVVLALIAVKMGYPVLDPVTTILISCFIAFAAFDIIRQNSRVLCDTAVIVEVKKIEDIVLGVKGVVACHKIRSRGREDDIYIDLHAQVSPQMHINNAHKISHDIEIALKKAIPGISEVIVHMEPNRKT